MNHPTVGLQAVIDAVKRLFEERDGPCLVALDGRSGAGKSTIAAALAVATDGVVIPSDDFFAAELTDGEWDGRDGAARARDAIDWRRLRREALEPLLAGRLAEWHAFDFAAGPRSDGSYGISADIVRREPARVIILDGAYSSRPELADLIDLSVLVEAPAAIRERRLADRETPSFLRAWHARWDPAEDYYFGQVRPGGAFDQIIDTGATDVASARQDTDEHR